MEIFCANKLVLLTQSPEKHVQFSCYDDSGILLYVWYVDWNLVLEFFEGEEAEQPKYVVDGI